LQTVFSFILMRLLLVILLTNLSLLLHSQSIVTKVEYNVQLSGEGDAVELMRDKVAKSVELKFGPGVLRIDFKGGLHYHSEPWYYLAVPYQNIRYDYYYVNPDLKTFTNFQDHDLKTLLVLDKMEFDSKPDTIMSHVCRKYTYFYKLYPKQGSKVISNMRTIAYFWLADDLTIDPAFKNSNFDNQSFFFPKATNQCPLKMLAEMYVDNKLLYSATYSATNFSIDVLNASEFIHPSKEQTDMKHFGYDHKDHH